MLPLPLPSSLNEAYELIESVRTEARALGRDYGPAPEAPEPYDCCGRGCEYCVFTVFYSRVQAWGTKVLG
jgi:hypothetical protein